MKTLLLLILLPVIANGQVSRFEGQSTFRHPGLPEEIIHYYRQYKAECYKDSAKVRYRALCPDYKAPSSHSSLSTTLLTCAVDHGWEERWEHKQPTFDGFMDWISKLTY